MLFGRYTVISSHVKDYFYGLYGRPPLPVDPEVQQLALKGYERGEEPITVRPADVLEPEMEAAKEATKDIAKDIGDVLTYALYPQVGMRFLKWKYGLETPPEDIKPKTLDDIQREDELVAKAKAGQLVEKGSELAAAAAPAAAPTPAAGLRYFYVHLDNQVYHVGVEASAAGSGSADFQPAAPPPAAPPTPSQKPLENEKPSEAAKPAEPATTAKPEKAAPKAAGAAPADGEGVLAPMSGVVIRYEVEKGSQVKSGDTVVVLEAMKMAIDLPAPVDGTVVEIRCGVGDQVSRDDVLAVVKP